MICKLKIKGIDARSFSEIHLRCHILFDFSTSRSPLRHISCRLPTVQIDFVYLQQTNTMTVLHSKKVPSSITPAVWGTEKNLLRNAHYHKNPAWICSLGPPANSADFSDRGFKTSNKGIRKAELGFIHAIFLLSESQ